MSLSMYQASAPVFLKNLTAMAKILTKAKEHVEAKKIDEQAFIQARLFPDMLAFPKQIQIAADAAKFAVARLAGVDAPSFEDNETTFDQLLDRVNKTIAFIETINPEQIDGSEDKDINLVRAGNPVTFKGQPYLLEQTYPNFYFHLTVAYALLRQGGVEIGKLDFLGMR
jgi:hypothetical protein